MSFTSIQWWTTPSQNNDERRLNVAVEMASTSMDEEVPTAGWGH